MGESRPKIFVGKHDVVNNFTLESIRKLSSEVSVYDTATDLLRATMSLSPSMIVLDHMMSPGDDFPNSYSFSDLSFQFDVSKDLIALVRKESIEVPILVYGTLGREEDQQVYLDAGANNYIDASRGIASDVLAPIMREYLEGKLTTKA